MATIRRKWVVGEAYDLEPTSVTDYAIIRLRMAISLLGNVFPFDCALCGAEKTLNILDPANLMISDYTCADAVGDTTCRSPPRPKTTKRPSYFVPGSIVACRTNKEESMRWPGIVEGCPDGTRDYLILGSNPTKVSAYFVTFIYPGDESDRQWVGGFFPTEELVPFVFKGYPSGITRAYKKALQMAKISSHQCLSQRLTEYSFVAHVARLRGQPVDSPLNPRIEPAYSTLLEKAKQKFAQNATEAGFSNDDSPHLGLQTVGELKDSLLGETPLDWSQKLRQTPEELPLLSRDIGPAPVDNSGNLDLAHKHLAFKVDDVD